ncbi:ER membrane protein complex subunit 10-like [Hydractinia symbiolongicarpus]|uniref:ER membrane protein complex subunit 10-like n=1 Tax=Hydractinia symbiolongicarpus TaxID=13093 RepID=UPI00254FDE69|nr:ER membrane protein complex subunit 10-like [Hydractinia symbiolongicarpus]
MYINFLPLLVVCSISQFSHCKKFSDDEITFSTHGNLLLQHAFGPNDQFSSRGEVVFKSSKGTAVFKDKIELSRSDLEKLEKLVKEDGLYFIRSPTKIGGALENNDTSYVSTFVRACYLYGSGLQETITVAVDYSGNVIGLNIVSPRSECKIDDFDGFEGAMFNSTVLVQQQVAGAVPDTQTFVKRIEQEKSDEAAGKGKDNRSFIAKYWMYIVPVFLVLMLGSQAEPPAEEGGE